MSEFFQMGGYAFYVWTSYALFLAIFLANLLIPIQKQKTIIRELQRKYRREAREHRSE